MKLKPSVPRSSRAGKLAYAMIEVIVGVSLMGITFVSLYAGISSGFALTQIARENLRATQILLERMEGIRLFNWDQLVDPTLCPQAFTNYYYPLATSRESKGITYVGRMEVDDVALDPPATYSNRMKQVTVTVSWTSGGVPRQRSMKTYSAKNGMQNYIYGGIYY